MPVIGHIHHNTIFKERQTTVITVATSIWGVGTARGSVAPGFSAPPSTEASMRLIHRPQPKVGCVYTQVTIKLSLSWVIWATHSLSHEMLLWGTLETWKPVCVWKKPSQTLINNLNGIHPFSKLKPGSWNCPLPVHQLQFISSWWSLFFPGELTRAASGNVILWAAWGQR